MQLVNLHNVGRKIYKFIRNNAGELSVQIDNDYYPYYWEEDEKGSHKDYLTDKKYRKVIVPSPRDVKKQSSPTARGIDIPFTTNYMLDNIGKIDKAPIKIGMVDIEILTENMPKEGDYSKPISSIALFDYDTKKEYCWFMGDLNGTIKEKEKIIIESFCDKLREEKYDIILIWNGLSFDIPYITARYKNWAERASIVGKSRYGYRTDLGEYINLPVGTSFLDMLQLMRKYTLNKFPSYSLDAVLTQEFGSGKEFNLCDFSKLTEDIKQRNISDTKDMGRLEDRYQLIEYFDNIRREILVDWEDLQSRTRKKNNQLLWSSNNTKILDVAVLKKAKDWGVILPNKYSDTEQGEYDGAMREVYKTGLFKDVHSVDYDSYYPRKMIDFCLDPINFVNKPTDNTITIDIEDRLTNKIKNTYYVVQNKKAIIVSVVQDMLESKLHIKKETKLFPPDSKEGKLIAIKYAAAKSNLNSAYGAMANKYFRLYSKEVAETTTFLARDLLLFSKEKAIKDNNPFLYVDTDGALYQGDKNYVDKLNNYIKEWSKKYNVEVTDLLDFKGTYQSIIIIAKCRYYGRLITSKGLKDDKCGVEATRSDSSKYTKEFQMKLFNKLLDGESKDDIINWIKEEIKIIKTLPLTNISKPVKIADKQYKTETHRGDKIIKRPPPPHVRGFINAKTHDIENLRYGDKVYMINMIPFGTESTKHPCIHLCFKHNECKIDRNKVDWGKVIKLNITNKAEKVFQIIGWDFDLQGQLSLF